MNNQGNMIPPKETNTTPVTDPEDVEVCELSERELRTIAVVKRFRELRENTARHLSEIEKKMHEQMRSSTKKQSTEENQP